jgi:hypothetical protein
MSAEFIFRRRPSASPSRKTRGDFRAADLLHCAEPPRTPAEWERTPRGGDAEPPVFFSKPADAVVESGATIPPTLT